MLPTKSKPDQILTWEEEPGLQGLVWNLTDPKCVSFAAVCYQRLPIHTSASLADKRSAVHMASSRDLASSPLAREGSVLSLG